MYKVRLAPRLVRVNARCYNPYRFVHHTSLLLNKKRGSSLGINRSKQFLNKTGSEGTGTVNTATNTKDLKDTKDTGTNTETKGTTDTETKETKGIKGTKEVPETEATEATEATDTTSASPEASNPEASSPETSTSEGISSENLDPVEETPVPERIETPEQETPDRIETPEDDEEYNSEHYLTTIFEKMEPYMDTYEVFKQLADAGFTKEQADEVIRLLIVQLNTKLSKLTHKYSHLYELENEKYLFESAQQELRVDITRSRENHINELINLIQILERDYNVIQDELNNDLLQLKTNNEVTINDQKQENTLQSKRIILKIQETNHKITTELNSNMRSEVESLRWHLSRWGIISILVCVFSGCASFYIFKRRAISRSNNPDEFIPLVIYEPSEFDEDDYHTDLDESVIK